MNGGIPKACSHGVALIASAYCPACEIVWHEEGLRDALKAVDRHTRKLEIARAAISAPLPAPPAA